MSLQSIARGEGRTVVCSVTLLSGPDGRAFHLRMGKRGQVERFQATMTPSDPEDLGDGRTRVLLTGTVSEADSVLLSRGVADLTVFATSPVARLVKAQVEVEDEVGAGGALG